MADKEENELTKALARAAGVEELRATLERVRDELPFEHLVYHPLPLGDQVSNQSVQLLTYTEGWISRYRDRDYFSIDPVVQGSRAALWNPFEWAAEDYRGGQFGDFFDDAEHHGVGRRGIVFPVSDEAGRRAVFSANSNHSRAEWERVPWSQVRLLASLAAQVHHKCLELTRSQCAELTGGEINCLQGLLNGATPKQMAGLMGVSESRVRALLQRACGKLSCRTTTQAVATALAKGLIG